MRLSRVRKEKMQPLRRTIFHNEDKTGGGDGGQWRGCQQCTLEKDSLSLPYLSHLHWDSRIVVAAYRPCSAKTKDSQRSREAFFGLETLPGRFAGAPR